MKERNAIIASEKENGKEKNKKKKKKEKEILKEQVENSNQTIRENNRWHVHLALGTHL